MRRAGHTGDEAGATWRNDAEWQLLVIAGAAFTEIITTLLTDSCSHQCPVSSKQFEYV